MAGGERLKAAAKKPKTAQSRGRCGLEPFFWLRFFNCRRNPAEALWPAFGVPALPGPRRLTASSAMPWPQNMAGETRLKLS